MQAFFWHINKRRVTLQAVSSTRSRKIKEDQRRLCLKSTGGVMEGENLLLPYPTFPLAVPLTPNPHHFSPTSTPCKFWDTQNTQYM